MKKHLSKIRIMELGLNLEGKVEATEAERAHIEACRICAETLEQEQRLTSLLSCECEHYREDLPDDFVAKTRARFLSPIQEQEKEQLETRQLKETRQLETEQTNISDQKARKATSVTGRSDRGVQKDLKALGALTLVGGLSFALGLMIVFFLVFPSYLVSLLVAFARTLVTIQVGLVLLAKSPSLAVMTFAYGGVTLLFCIGLFSHAIKSFQPQVLTPKPRKSCIQTTGPTREKTKSKK